MCRASVCCCRGELEVGVLLLLLGQVVRPNVWCPHSSVSGRLGDGGCEGSEGQVRAGSRRASLYNSDPRSVNNA